MSDRRELAGFLLRSRERLTPTDVGLPMGARRRIAGLRREEVAQLAGMSVDYYARLEQNRGPNPSPQLLAALARALRLDEDGRDHLFHLAGHVPPGRMSRCTEHVAPALLLVLDRLYDTPAQVLSELGDVLAQNPMSVALMGPNVGSNILWSWFAEPDGRARFRECDVDALSRAHVADLRATVARRADDPRPGMLVERLIGASEEFAALWAAHDVAVRRGAEKTIRHPEIGVVTVACDVLLAGDGGQRLVVFTAPPGSSGAEQLALLRVVGLQTMSASAGAAG
ncbi:helix-turn-helix transcriptional regulator [Embleya sp. NBC_00896]|uniref:helix-turn-helix transcriptional regulator n=1 Tax=Embleya sp. NBC_00896 TaxID=2975961 RepID=UPI00386DE583|nr:helix-turn-helix transcriptional regulator [Embleya sp. NBC_00896]